MHSSLPGSGYEVNQVRLALRQVRPEPGSGDGVGAGGGGAASSKRRSAWVGLGSSAGSAAGAGFGRGAGAGYPGRPENDGGGGGGSVSLPGGAGGGLVGGGAGGGGAGAASGNTPDRKLQTGERKRTEFVIYFYWLEPLPSEPADAGGDQNASMEAGGGGRPAYPGAPSGFDPGAGYPGRPN